MSSGLGFLNPDTKDSVFVVVTDKFPQMQNVHVEGRRVVEMSVELFVEMMGRAGYYVVDPATGKIAEKEAEE